MKCESLKKLFYKNHDQYEAIYKQRISAESTLVYNFNIGEYQAFLVVNNDLVGLVAKILKLDKKLMKVINELPGVAVKQFSQNCLIEEIKLTNEIEGVHSTRKEIYTILASKGKNQKNRLYGLVQKYSMLLEGQPLELRSCEDIRALYNEFVLEEIRQNDAENVPDGKLFRKGGVDVLSATQKAIHKGMYPEEKIIEALNKALEILHDERVELLFRIAVFHYLFGYIHPFYDGNGRMVRFISSYFLVRELEPLVGVGLSYTIKQQINKYYDLFKETNDFRNRGELTHFVAGFLELVAESIEGTCLTLEQNAEKLTYYAGKLLKLSNPGTPLHKVLYVLAQNALFAREGIAIEVLASAADISESTARKLLNTIPQELLSITKSGKKNLYSLLPDAVDGYFSENGPCTAVNRAELPKRDSTK